MTEVLKVSEDDDAAVVEILRRDEQRRMKLLLVQMYRDRPQLWDQNDGLYKNPRAKLSALTEIAAALNQPLQQVKDEINGLRTQFFREQRRVRQSGHDHETDFAYQSKWWLYRELQFLGETFKLRSIGISGDSEAGADNSAFTKSDLDDDFEHNQSNGDTETSVAEEFERNNETLAAIIPKATPASPFGRPLAADKTELKRRKVCDHEETLLESCLRQLVETHRQPEEDEVDLFLKFIGAELRKKPERVRNHMRNQIYAIVCDLQPQPLPLATGQSTQLRASTSKIIDTSARPTTASQAPRLLYVSDARLWPSGDKQADDGTAFTEVPLNDLRLK